MFDAHRLLSLDKSILEAQVFLDLLHLQSRVYDLWHLKLSIAKADDASRRIEAYCKKEDIQVDFIVLQFFRADHPRWLQGQLNRPEHEKCKDREKDIRPLLDTVSDTRCIVDTFIKDPSSLLDGRLRFRFHR